MGRAARWLRNLWGGNKKENRELKSSSSFGGAADDRREKKRWSFTRSARDAGDVQLDRDASTADAVEATWFRSFYADAEEEKQSKHAIAVAAATAAAADAAVAAAQAAVAVVRLTSQGRAAVLGGGGGASAREQKAAVKIQTAFRGHLAKKALRALKALVKLQALVRGYLVRKQAAATLHSIQALIRAQVNIRAHRARIFPPVDRRLHPETKPRSSIERSDASRGELSSSIHSRRLSASLDNGSGVYDRSPKIVEMDTCRPRSRSSRRTSPSILDPAEDFSSPLPCQIPARISIPDSRNFHDYDWSLPGEKCRSSATAQSTPRYMNFSGNVAVTPAKSVCSAEGALRRSLNAQNCPNYMANTQSFKAKVRPQSAPKQRPDPAGGRKRVPLSEVMMESRASLSGIGMQSSCNRIQEAFNFAGRLERSSELEREEESEFYLHRKW